MTKSNLVAGRPELVDTHCHIQSAGLEQGEQATKQLWAKSPELISDRLVKNAAEAGVTRLICVGCDLEDSRLVVDFVQNHKECWASIGIHPHEAQHYADKPEKLKKFISLADKPKVMAIGECGLDFYYKHSQKKDQLTVLKFQIELALQHDLPLIFHVREAFEDFWPVFDSYRGLQGVLHSFTDSTENLSKALARNLYIGVNGIATFTKSAEQLEMYRAIPLEKLLLETDAPFLTPVPYRGNINEPKQVGTIVEFLTGLRDESREDLARATTANAQKLFGI